MRLIRTHMLVILCASLSACAQDQATQPVVTSTGDGVHLKVAECHTTGADSQRDSGCAAAIAERDKAAWRSKGRGIQIKSEARP